jgi:hypothetical protein
MTQFASVKLTAEFVDEVRKEIDVSHRSLASQVEYWAKLGRAIEKSEGFSMQRVHEALGGRLKIEALPPAGDERSAMLTRLGQVFDAPDDLTRAFFLNAAQAPGSVAGTGTPRAKRDR